MPIDAIRLELKTSVKLRSSAILPFCGVLLAVSLMSSTRLNAHATPASPAQSQEQLPPQPAAKQPPRTTLAGSWKLNRNESDDPRQKIRAAESSSNSTAGDYPPGGNYPGGGYPGGGYPGGGNPGGGRRGGYPSGSGPYGGQQNQDIEDNPKIQPLIHPSGLVTIELKTPEIDVTDYDLHKLSLYTDGRKLQKPRTTAIRRLQRIGTEANSCRTKKARSAGK